jgi:hypothetical protein
LSDLARDAAAPRRVRHEHGIAAGKRQIGGERGTLIAPLFLHHLHENDLAAADDLLDLVGPAATAPCPLRHLFQRVLRAHRFDGLGSGVAIRFGDRDRLADDLSGLRLVVLLVVVVVRMRFAVLLGFGIEVARAGLGHRMGEVARLKRHVVPNRLRRFAFAFRCLIGSFRIRPALAPGSVGASGPALPLERLVPPAATPAAPSAAPGRGLLILGGLRRAGAALLLGLLLKQRLTVGDRDLVIVWMNFGEG